MDIFEVAATPSDSAPDEVCSNVKLHMLSKEAKLQRRRNQIRVSQVRHRQKKARHLEELESTAATLRAMITGVHGEISVLCKENEHIKATLGSIVLNNWAHNYPTTVAVGKAVFESIATTPCGPRPNPFVVPAAARHTQGNNEAPEENGLVCSVINPELSMVGSGIRNVAASTATCDISLIDLPALIGNIDATQTAKLFGSANNMELSMFRGSVENVELEGQANDVDVADPAAVACDCGVLQPTGVFDNADSMALGMRELNLENIQADGQTDDCSLIGLPAFVGETSFTSE